jgi:histone-lysine N-methyltransferase SETD2
VNGELRIGFFSKRPIAANEELTFDYQFQKVGKVQQKCYCGSEKCRGYLGVSTSNNNNQQQQSSPGGAFDHLWDEEESSDNDNDESHSSDRYTEKSDLKQKRKSSNKEDFEVKRKPLNPPFKTKNINSCF